MREHGAPAVDQGVGKRVAQKGWGLAGFGVCGLITPNVFQFQSQNNRASLRARVSRETKVNKACDESGLAAELFQHAPDEFLVELLHLSNGILQHGSATAGWKKTLFTMLPKKTRAKLVTDFRPIANIRLLYKVFAYMILARVEQSLESFQPKAQHGFRSGRRMEEHVLTTNLILDKSRAAGLPVWILSLKLGNAVGSFASTKYFKPIDLDSTMHLSQSNRCRSR